jgi:hypothetical protein
MADISSQQSAATGSETTEWDAGGLRFAVSFRAPVGATLRVSGPVPGTGKALLRFDDFVDSPHYHAPADGDSINLDRTIVGEPLDWFVCQMRDHLEELLTSAGLAEILPDIDLSAVSDNVERIRAAMIRCVPNGYVRVPGVGLQRADA